MLYLYIKPERFEHIWMYLYKGDWEIICKHFYSVLKIEKTEESNINSERNMGNGY